MLVSHRPSRNRCTVAVAACAALALLAVPAPAPADPGHEGTDEVIVAPKPRPVFGRHFSVSGWIVVGQPSGRSVELQEAPWDPLDRYSDRDFVTVATAATDWAGRYRFDRQALASARYRVVADTDPPLASFVTPVAVRYAVTLGARRQSTGAVRLAGSVAPARAGGAVSLERRVRRRWRRIATARLRGDGDRFASRVRLRKGALVRAVLRADPDAAPHLATGVSRPRSIRRR